MYIRFKAFWNFSKLHFVFTFWPLRKSYCGDAHHAIYGKHSLNHHLQHCAHSVYQIHSVLKLLEITVCFTHFGFYEIATPVVRIMLTMANIVLIIISNIAHTVYITLKGFETFRNCSLFCTFWLLRNFYSGDAHHANHCKHSLKITWNIAHTVYIRFIAFSNFSKLQFVLHIFAVSKFQLL